MHHLWTLVCIICGSRATEKKLTTCDTISTMGVFLFTLLVLCQFFVQFGRKKKKFRGTVGDQQVEPASKKEPEEKPREEEEEEEEEGDDEDISKYKLTSDEVSRD